MLGRGVLGSLVDSGLRGNLMLDVSNMTVLDMNVLGNFVLGSVRVGNARLEGVMWGNAMGLSFIDDRFRGQT